jgi:hypothetical protein
VLEGASYFSTTGEPIALPLDKTGGQKHGEDISLLPGEKQNAEVKKPMWEWGNSAECRGEKAHVGVGQLSVKKVSHCTALEKPGTS